MNFFAARLKSRLGETLWGAIGVLIQPFGLRKAGIREAFLQRTSNQIWPNKGTLQLQLSEEPTSFSKELQRSFREQ